MTLQDCTKLLAPLAVTLGHELDEPDFRAYHRALEDVPPRLLSAACERATRTPRGKFDPRFPTAPTLRQWAEEARQAAARAERYLPCADCEHHAGWVPTHDGRVTRCRCWHAHQAKLKSGGLAQPLALPAGEEVEA